MIINMPCISDFVSGALNKLKSNRTPSITPQQERTGRYYLYLFKWTFIYIIQKLITVMIT